MTAGFPEKRRGEFFFLFHLEKISPPEFSISRVPEPDAIENHLLPRFHISRLIVSPRGLAFFFIRKMSLLNLARRGTEMKFRKAERRLV